MDDISTTVKKTGSNDEKAVDTKLDHIEKSGPIALNEIKNPLQVRAFRPSSRAFQGLTDLLSPHRASRPSKQLRMHVPMQKRTE